MKKKASGNTSGKTKTVPVRKTDVTRAIDELGWEPKRSNLRAMIGDAWGWAQKPGYSR